MHPVHGPGAPTCFAACWRVRSQEELQSALAAGRIDDHQILRLDMPPVTVSDVYDMRETAREIARRIVQAIRQNPE